MRTIKTLLVAGVLAALPAAANAQWYAGFDLGVAKNEDSSVSGGTTSYTTEFNTLFDITEDGHVGYAFGPYKLEGELGYRTGKVSDVNSLEGGGSVSALSMMVNGIYEFMPASSWHPFVGVGIGTAFIDANGTTMAGVTQYQGNDWTFAYQGFAGIAYDMTKEIALTAQYRYFATSDYEVSGRSGSSMDAEYANHSVMLGMNYKFGVAPAPVAPIPVAAPAPKPAPVPMAKPMPAPQKNFIVFFDFNKADITPEAAKIITQAADTAKTGHAARVDLTGHADRSGPDKYNMALSLKRANAVKAAMVKQGIPADQISVVGKGESVPLIQTPDGVREPQNRRVEIVLP